MRKWYDDFKEVKGSRILPKVCFEGIRTTTYKLFVCVDATTVMAQGLLTYSTKQQS
jgi:hypothetical protein